MQETTPKPKPARLRGPQKPIKITPDAEERYLDYFAETGMKWRAAAYIGVTQAAMITHKKKFPEFLARCDEAYGHYLDTIEAEVRRRALDGVERDVYYKGAVVGVETLYSDRLLELTAKRHIPEYREKQTVDLNVAGGVLVIPMSTSPGQDGDKEWENAHRVYDNDDPQLEDKSSDGRDVKRS